MRPNHWLEEDAARTAAPLTLALGGRRIKQSMIQLVSPSSDFGATRRAHEHSGIRAITGTRLLGRGCSVGLRCDRSDSQSDTCLRGRVFTFDISHPA